MERDGRRSRQGRTLRPKQVAGIVGMVILLILILANFGDVKIDLVVADFTLPLAIVIIVSALLGAIAGWAFGRRSGRS
ncbi:MAG TPA: LapA family protein [Acidimicrobiia bacterium]|jgi:uncharacterized integral membrane protein